MGSGWRSIMKETFNHILHPIDNVMAVKRLGEVNFLFLIKNILI